MKFTVNLKPFQALLDLVVIPGNISKFFKKSTILQLSVNSQGKLVLNSEADRVISKGLIKGSVDSRTDLVSSVDAGMFKQLVSTLDTEVIDIEMVDGSVTLYSGKSKFIIASQDYSGARLESPADPSGPEFSLNADIWKLVKDKQMFALSDSFVKRVYTYIYNGLGFMIVGDFENGLFTMIKKSALPVKCLISSNIVNIILSVDPGSKLYQAGQSFVIHMITDAYELISEIKPRYEDHPDMGSYQAEMITALFGNASDHGLIVPVSRTKLLQSQTNLLSDGDSPVIKWSSDGNRINILSDNVDGDLPCEVIGMPEPWDVVFNLKSIISVISNFSSDTINLHPASTEGEGVNALVFVDPDVSVILAALDGNE